MPTLEINLDGIYFRALQDSFLWKKGAILECDEDEIGLDDSQYLPINDLDIWNTTENNGDEYISGRIIENNPEWFERVYPIELKNNNVILENKEETKKSFEFAFEPVKIQ